MFFDELDRLMLEIVDFADFIIIFAENKPNAPTEIRTHDPCIRFQHNNIQRPSGYGYSASCIA
jgi:hypothetical protein